jgi:GntR family transcriptional regulator
MVQKNIPLAQQVVSEILSGVEAKGLAGVDGMLPSEAELGRRYNVSRATIREALSRLEQRGVVVRRHGVGTFIVQPAPVIEAGLEQLESIDTLAHRMGLATHMGEALIEERTAEAHEAEQLQVLPASPVLAISRVIMMREQPVAYLIDIVAAPLLQKSDLGEAFSGSVLDVFLQRGEPALSHSRTDITAEAATAVTARKLGLRRGDMVLKLEAQLYARDGRVADYSLSYFVPGYFRFHVVRRIPA